MWLLSRDVYHLKRHVGSVLRNNQSFMCAVCCHIVLNYAIQQQRSFLCLNVGRAPGLMSEPLMAPPQLKPSPPLLHKEPPILIKQASLDKSKGGKKDKVWIYSLF